MRHPLRRNAHIVRVKASTRVAVAVGVHTIADFELANIRTNCSNRPTAVGAEDRSRLYRSPGTRSVRRVPHSKTGILERDDYVIVRKPGYRHVLDVKRTGWSSGFHDRCLHGLWKC